MTKEKATLLMNMYLANDASDEEAKELFLHMSESSQSRMLFAKMKHVHEELLTRVERPFPKALDAKLSALGIAAEEKSPMLQRTSTVRISSALFSGIVMCLVGIMVYTILTNSVLRYQMIDGLLAKNFPYFNGQGSIESEQQWSPYE